MSGQVEISIPSYATASNPKPHTVYNISLRLPLRSFTIQKRYSDFTALHSSLTSQTNVSPPFSLPSKSFFTKTTSSSALAESRRHDLEAYLIAINTAADSTWRNTSAWRTFLNLPSTTTSRSQAATNLHSALTTPNNTTSSATSLSSPTTDPVVWLDQHRELKAHLHDARLEVNRRDQASSVQSQHEAGTAAKKCLVRAGTLIAALERGLKAMESGASWSGGAGGGGAGQKLGEGEIRRRKDLLSAAARERDGLENLLSAMAAKSTLDRAVAGAQRKEGISGEKGELLGTAGNSSMSAAAGQDRPGRAAGGGRRVLGRETEKTKALDNQGVLQLQQQLMKDQDEDVMNLAQAVAKQKQLGVQIQEELAVQTDILDLLDEDVDRVDGKIKVGRKRIDKVS